MVIDSSALVAIIAEESDYLHLIKAIAGAAVRKMSAASLLETSIVALSKKGDAAMAVLDAFVADAGIQVIDLTENQARIALRAYKRFGKGTGHRAQLNILDCCTYALAFEAGEPLLFKGGDFGATDIAIVE